MTIAGSTSNPIDGPLGGAAAVAPFAPNEVIPALLAGGVVSAEEAVTTGITVREVGRSHAVFVVEVDGETRAYLKSFGPSRGASDGSAERERAVAAVATERPDVAALIAPVLPWDGPGDVVVTRALAGRLAWADETESGDPSQHWADLVSRLASPLALFHRATRDLAAPNAVPPAALAPAVPWGLTLASGDAPPEIWLTPHIATATGRIAADPRICDGLRAARAVWRDMCLIHADLKHDNVLILDDDAGVAILDWEMARIGDPAWDLAALAARLPMTALGNAAWDAKTIERIALLLSSYATASQLPAPALARRMPAYIASWLVIVAIQHQSTQPHGSEDDGATELLEKAATGFENRDRITRELIGSVS